MLVARRIMIAVAIAIVLVPMVWLVVWRAIISRPQPPTDTNFSLQTGNTVSGSEPRQDVPVVPYLDDGELTGVVVAEGSFAVVNEAVQGAVRLVSIDGQTFLQLSGFSIADGERHFVYLSDRDELDGLANLGELRADAGTFSYPIDRHIDVAAFEEVLIWNEMTEQIVAVAELQWQ